MGQCRSAADRGVLRPAAQIRGLAFATVRHIFTRYDGLGSVCSMRNSTAIAAVAFHRVARRQALTALVEDKFANEHT
jgi:hypothetical protein